MTSLDPAYCADGCGRLAETERPTADGRREQTCSECATPAPRKITVHLTGPGAQFVSGTAMTNSAKPTQLGEHSSNPREDA